MNKSALQDKFQHLLKQLVRWRIVLFALLLVGIYSFIVWRVSTYVKAKPDQNAVASQTNPSQQPHIDQATINKIKQLQDNSVNVQTLFDQARQSPFEE